ncbi:hypothetical protein [Marinobacter changyiensis]|nr:hypothetical protein [Marinobacter changyiensis]
MSLQNIGLTGNDILPCIDDLIRIRIEVFHAFTGHTAEPMTFWIRELD